MQGICDQNQIRIKQLEIERVLHLEEITDLKTRLQEEQEEAKINASIHVRLEQDFHDSMQEIERLGTEIEVIVFESTQIENAFISRFFEMLCLRFTLEASSRL